MKSVVVYGEDARLLLINAKAMQEYFKLPTSICGSGPSALDLYPDDHLVVTNYIPTLAERRFKQNIISIKRARQLIGYRWQS